MMTKEGSTKFINCMTARGWGSSASAWSYGENAIYSNDDQGTVYQNFEYHDPRGRVSWAKEWPYKSYRENALSSTLSIYSTLIANNLWDYRVVFLAIVEFYLFYYGAVYIQYEPF